MLKLVSMKIEVCKSTLVGISMHILEIVKFQVKTKMQIKSTRFLEQMAVFILLKARKKL